MHKITSSSNELCARPSIVPPSFGQGPRSYSYSLCVKYRDLLPVTTSPVMTDAVNY